LGSAQLVTDYQGETYEQLEYTPYGELWVEHVPITWETPFRFTGKERDGETGLYYFGARYLNPQTSMWLSADPAMGEYVPQAPVNDEAKKHNENLPGLGGVFNYVNLHAYHYAGNNPVKLMDPDGRTTEIDIITGDVKSVTQDGSNDIIAYAYTIKGERIDGVAKYIGKTLFWDSFISPDTGKAQGRVYIGESIDKEINELFKLAGEKGYTWTWVESRNGGAMDIKSKLKGHKGYSYHGFLYKGSYITLREAGNILAGMNAAQFNMDFSDFQKGAGGLHANGMMGVLEYKLFGFTYGTAPYRGENYYQFRSSLYGYKSVVSNKN
jgi:filamentous hemagglutinin